MWIALLINGGFMDNLTQVWDQVKEILFLEIATVQFNTWIKPIVPMTVLDNVIYLKALSKFVKKIVSEKYIESIEYNFQMVLGKPVKVIIIDHTDEIYDKILDKSLADSPKSIEKKDDPMQISFADVNNIQSEPIKSCRSNLNPKYTFDNFVRGNSNDYALTVALEVAKNPGKKYNPLFIYGGSGLGKTHLMQAIGNEILKNNPNAKVIYITSENFMNEFISTITDNKNSVINSNLFRDKYRNADVLMIDDIQFISGKEGTQIEIHNTFNSLWEGKKQIILTSDKLPSEIENLEERLVSRFNSGIKVDIQQPDFETRVAILQHKIKMDRFNLIPNKVIEFIAENITSNIRELEGAIISVEALKQHENPNKIISEDEFLEIAKRALAVKEKKKKTISLELIKDVVTKYYKLEKDDLVSKSRQKNIAEPRQIAMHLSRQLTTFSLVKIANSFNRDHSTIMHGDEKIEKMRKENPNLDKEIKAIISMLEND